MAIKHIGNNLQARSSGTSYLSNTALAQTHRSSSMASSWLNFFARFFFPLFFRSRKLSQLRGAEPATRHWASYVALSQKRGNGESALYGADGFSDAAFAVPTNQISGAGAPMPPTPGTNWLKQCLLNRTKKQCPSARGLVPRLSSTSAAALNPPTSGLSSGTARH